MKKLLKSFKMSDLIKKDFLFFQNEILQDIKKVETKLSDKIESIYSYIQEMSISNEKRFNSLNSIVIFLIIILMKPIK